MKGRAFTLIEMICVLLLIGLFSAAAVLAFSRPLRVARARQAFGQICAFDSAARQAARRGGRQVQLVIDSFEHELSRREAGTETRETATLQLPAGLRIEQMRTAGGDVSESKYEIRYSPQGISRSYALRLVGDGVDQWMLVAGLSGQVTVTNNEATVENILATSARGDAD